MADHRKPRHGDQQDRSAEVLPFLAELLHRGPLVRVVHEVDEPLEDAVVVLQDVLDGLAVLGVLLHLQHVHKGAVVDPVHPEGADEVPLHQPERLGQQEPRQNSSGKAASNSSRLMPCSAREGTPLPCPGCGYQRRW